MEFYLKVCFTVLCLFQWNYAIDTQYMYESCNSNYVLETSLQLETSKSLTYPFQMNCTYTITVPSAKTILVVISRFEVEEKVTGICTDYLNIYDGGDNKASLLNTSPLCGSSVTGNFTSTGSSLTFDFKSDETAVYRGFGLLVTAIENAPCTSAQFSCNNGLCIDTSLKCDGYNQCGDSSDEINCQENAASSTAGIDNTPLIIGVIVGLVVVGGLIGAIILHVYKKNQWKKFLHQHLEDPDVWNPSPSYPVTRKYYRNGNYNTLNIDVDNVPHIHQYESMDASADSVR
ncbi:hypothetical protein SNE40_013275 [Patella caerulea]|uniref:CUB domain-containing protein n=1 Tax=Patella caerulea TaxID=87958 RepID=A0AAN8JN96_PATCE